MYLLLIRGFLWALIIAQIAVPEKKKKKKKGKEK